MFDQEAIDAFNEKKQQEAERQQALSAAKEVTDKVEEVRKVVEFSTTKLIADKKVHPQKVEVLTQLATPQDIDKVVKSLDKLAVALKPELHDDQPVIAAINRLNEQIKQLPTEMPEVESVEEVTVKNIAEFKGYIKPLLDAVGKLELNPIFDPKIEVKPADVTVTTEKMDTKPLLDSLGSLTKEFAKLSSRKQPEVDLKPVIEATKATTKAINSLSFPVPNYILPFRDINGKAAQVQLDSSGNVPTSGGSSSTTNYATKIDDTTTANAVYIGKAAIASSGASAVWQIKKLDTSTLALDKTWADGNDSFDNIWNNRASLSYS